MLLGGTDDTPSVPIPYEMVSAFTEFETEERKRRVSMIPTIIPNTFFTIEDKTSNLIGG